MAAQSRREDAALRDHQQMLSTIVDSSQDWIWALDLSGHHTYSNHAVERILGYSPQEFQGMGLDLLHPEDRKVVDAKWPDRVRARQGWQNIVLRWRTKGGEYRYLESTAVPILGLQGQLQGFRGVDRDITEQEQARRLLQQSEERYRGLVNTMKDIIYSVSADGKIVFIGPQVNRYGFTVEEMVSHASRRSRRRYWI